VHADDECFFDNTPGNSLWPLTFTDGLTDVTAAVRAGTYTTATLAPNAHHDLHVTIKNRATPTCPAGDARFTTSGQGQSMAAGVIATDAE
jgi:hypothetical protein